MADKPKRPTLRPVYNREMTEEAHRQARQATIDAMAEGVKGG